MIHFDLDDQPRLLTIARELTHSSGFPEDAIAIGVNDERDRLLCVMVIQDVEDEGFVAHWGAAQPLRRSVIPLCIDFAFRTTQCSYAFTTIDPENAAMLIVALKAGWRVVGFQAGGEASRPAVVLRMNRPAWTPPSMRDDTDETEGDSHGG